MRKRILRGVNIYIGPPLSSWRVALLVMLRNQVLSMLARTPEMFSAPFERTIALQTEVVSARTHKLQLFGSTFGMCIPLKYENVAMQ